MILSFLSETTGGSDMEFDKQQLEHFLTVSKVEKRFLTVSNVEKPLLETICNSYGNRMID